MGNGNGNGGLAGSMFYGTFSGCSGLTGLPYRTASGDYLWDIYPEATGNQVSGCHGNNTGLDGWPSSVPAAWR